MKTDTNPTDRVSMARDYVQRSVRLAFLYLPAVPLFLITATAAVLVGIWCAEFFTPWPSIPDPIERTEQPTRTPTSTSELETAPIVHIYIHPQDMKTLGRTLKHDVIRHGGAVIHGNDETRRWTFAVSRQYMTRIQPLIGASGIRPPAKAYREWARYVYANPKDSKVTGPANVAVTFHFGYPWFSGTTSMWAAIASAVMAGSAILTMPVLLILPRLFPHLCGQGVRSAAQPTSKI